MRPKLPRLVRWSRAGALPLAHPPSLHSQGYDRDPVLIARAAIEQARAEGIDVVLVDTAGRMQNNGPLMQQLAKLVAVNEPDLVLFVGEVRRRRRLSQASLFKMQCHLLPVAAPPPPCCYCQALVGNDGVSQLVEFDRALVDYAADRSRPRRIDGIVLTKFDTIDDKVGASLSMVHRTGIPVVFLGVGQAYPDLRKLNVGAVVKALLA